MVWERHIIIMKNLLEKIEEIIHCATQVVYFYRKQNHTKGYTSAISVINLVEKYYNDAERVGFMESVNFLLPIWKELLEATEFGDEVHLADIYDSKLLPALFEVQSCIIDALCGNPPVYWEDNMNILKDKDTCLFEMLSSAVESEKREYLLSFACTGDVTLAVNTEPYGKVMLASSINPWQEAIVYGDELETTIARKCVIFGLGMGYHVKYIATLPYLEEITVLESDLEQLRICMMYTDMKRLLSDKRVKIVLCNKASDYTEWLKKSSKDEDTVYKIWYPSVKTIEDNAVRELLENYWVNINSANNLGKVLLDNFEKNCKLGDKPVDVLQEEFQDKDLIIVGAGPSLDNNLDYLRKLSSKDNVRILCVGKAARKIISENIMPDYIVMIDGKAGTRWQIKGIEDCGVPLIYLSTVAHNVAADYKGKRYVAYQEGIELSKEYAEKEGFIVFQSGGSVATFAIDMAIRMKCDRVICVGLDMGFIGERTHAEGIGRKVSSEKSLRKVEAVGGGEIYTSKTLDIYRKWIERRIENVKEVKFINASSGAKIRGMEEKSLEEIEDKYFKQSMLRYIEKQSDVLGKHASLMKEFLELNENEDMDNILRYLNKLYYGERIENEEKVAEQWSCFCKLLLSEIGDNIFEKKYFNYRLAIYSILMRLSKSADYTNKYLDEILTNGEVESMYFVYHQLKRKGFTKKIEFDKEARNTLNKLYDKCYEIFSNDLKEYLVKIPLAERNKNLVMILTVQFLSERHAPTKSVVERAKAYKAMGKNVVIINTTEHGIVSGYVPIYDVEIGNVMTEYDDVNEITTGDCKISFLQIPKDLPVPYRMQVLAHMIKKTKPYYILSIGTGSILADLCGNIVPCASMAVVFSTLPQTKNKMKILGRKLSPEEKVADSDISDIIESKFTFELKKQEKKFTRPELSLPQDKFILVVVGIRLEYEISHAFMEMLEKVCRSGCYVVFAGIMDNYDTLIKQYVDMEKNSSFIGYCDDILALMEICDLYVNPDRLGGGFSIIEAFSKGKPGIYLKKGDIYTAAGEDFAVDDFDTMARQILKYKDDKDYYNKMSDLAIERSKVMTSSVEALADIDRQICQRIEEKYW